MLTLLEKEVRAAMRLRRELTAGSVPRRELLKMGLLGSGALLLGAGPSLAAAGTLISPYTQPFVDPLVVPKTAAEAGCEVSAAQMAAHGGGTAAVDPRTAEWKSARQYSSRFVAQRHYIIPLLENPAHRWHRDLPLGTIWGYGGCFPGVTVAARYGEPVALRFTNELPANVATDFGSPRSITHLHNFHSASESDGGPWNDYDCKAVAEPAQAPWFRDHHYTMARAGFTDPQFQRYYDGRNDYDGGNWGDPTETLGTLFYHSHTPEFTTANVYKGGAGLFLAFDERDTGEETTGLRLPSGRYDVPLGICDKVFDANGRVYFDVFENSGILGDKAVVNGTVQPYLAVDRRRYRFRCLNMGPSRILQLHLYNATTRQWINNPFLQLSSDGNLLRHGVLRSGLFVSVAERHDVLLDFKRIAATGDHLILYNRLEQVDGNKPTGKLLTPGMPIMEFRVGADVADPSFDYFANPNAVLREQPVVDLSRVVRKREFRTGRSGGGWVINSQTFDPDIKASQASVKRNTAELWTLTNGSGGWVHPMHVHYEEMRLQSRNGVAPPVYEQGRLDVAHLGPGETVTAFIQFRDFPDPEFNPPNPAYKPEAGRYVMHCHNTTHEDHGMMARFDVVP